jgi:hypothetical protein
MTKYNGILYLIILLALGTSTVQSQKLNSLSVNAGYIIPANEINNGFSMEMRTDFAEVLKYIFLFPSLGYKNLNKIDQDIELKTSHINFGAYFVGYFNSKPRGFYGGLGIHYHIINTEEIDTNFLETNQQVVDKTDTKLGFSLSVGYLYKLRKISFYIEPAFTVIPDGYSTQQVRVGFAYYLR